MFSLKPLTVLFLSTNNAARSIVAEALLRERGGDRFIARSAGWRPLPAVNPHTLALLAAEGVSIDGLHSKNWNEFFASAHLIKIDVIVTLSREAQENCPAWPFADFMPLTEANNPVSAIQRLARDIVEGSELEEEEMQGPVRVHWPIDDPLAAEKADVMEWKFRKCFNTLEARIASLIKNRPAQNVGELLLQFKNIGMVV